MRKKIALQRPESKDQSPDCIEQPVGDLPKQTDTQPVSLNEAPDTKDEFFFQSDSFLKALDAVEGMNKKKPH